MQMIKVQLKSIQKTGIIKLEAHLKKGKELLELALEDYLLTMILTNQHLRNTNL